MFFVDSPSRHPNSSLFLSGFSLGGNVITKVRGARTRSSVAGFLSLVRAVQHVVCTCLLSPRGKKALHSVRRVLMGFCFGWRPKGPNLKEAVSADRFAREPRGFSFLPLACADGPRRSWPARSPGWCVSQLFFSFVCSFCVFALFFARRSSWGSWAIARGRWGSWAGPLPASRSTLFRASW